jgi:hypothetical protein
MADRQPYIYQFDDIFFLTIAGTFFGFLAVLVKACLKSNCTQIKCLGFECIKEPSVEDDTETEDLEVGLPPIPQRTPSRR